LARRVGATRATPSAALAVWALSRGRNLVSALTWDNPLLWPRDHGLHPLADLEGPAYQLLAPFRARDLASAAEREAGEVLWLTGTVRDRASGAPVGGAVLDLWQASPKTSRYSKLDASLRGRFRADARGGYAIRTVMPALREMTAARRLDRLLLGLPRRALSALAGRSLRWQRPALVHVIVRALGYAPLTTQLYVDGDSSERLEADPANAVRRPRASLRVRPARTEGREGLEVRFDFSIDRRAGKLQPPAPQPRPRAARRR
jgi:catechol 1,2-dioxygenase